LLPIHLINEYRFARKLQAGGEKSEFDGIHGVDTDGKFGGWTYLSDLNIRSSNWIDGNPYLPIEPKRFNQVLQSLNIAFDEYTFIDFGSGKGRALLLASEYPFREIVGLEFASELHYAANLNIERYSSPTQKCKNIRSINTDFLDFVLPHVPLILFFFDPCRGPVLEKLLSRIGDYLKASSTPFYIAYIAPRLETEILFSASTLKEIRRNAEFNFVIYSRS
jgi:hypothetical protein